MQPTETFSTPMPGQLDSAFHAALARSTAALSPSSALQAASDWTLHLSVSPGRCLDLARLALRQGGILARYASEQTLSHGKLPAQAPASAPTHQNATLPTHDRRFAAAEWQQWPFNLLQQSFVLTEEWWNAATRGVWGVEKHHEDLVAFTTRQILDIFSPGNFVATNPVVLKRTLAQGGANLLRGALLALEDLRHRLDDEPPVGAEHFVVGRDVGVTPGKVVLKNHLIELIQYAPTTETVHPEPILITPAWIMKYYILDLSPHNSLIKYLVDQGFTVFCISWKNPTAEDRDLSMEDYLQLGFHAALDAVTTIVPERKVHAAGYCLGGTLQAIAVAAMARDGDARLASMTLFAAQTDFTEPGELGLFINEDQVSLLEAQMAATGYLTAEQMAGAFQMLRSYDLLWSRLINEYLLGDRPAMNDLMAWNADATRMPAKMHSQYLRRLFLNDDLSEGRYPVHGKPVSLSDVSLPTFVVGTETDHVAPWHSVHKLHYLSPAEITFALTSGGHNAGVVNPPGSPHHHYRLLTRPANGNYLPPDDWFAATPVTEGSWWPAWLAWLQARSGTPVTPPPMGAHPYLPVADAPGSYVLQK